MASGRYHWSNCAYPAVFFNVNALASLPWVAFLFHPGWDTLKVAFLITIFFVYIEIVLKMSLSAFLRSILVKMTGRVKSTINLIKEVNQ